MSRQSNYSPQIDSLRALAITVVMLHHFIDGPFLLAGFGNVMFFVLSGYFGTRGLLKARTKIHTGAISAQSAFKTFYQRRYSRILPLHYLVLCCSAVAGIAFSRSEFLWNALFVSNFAMWHQGVWFGRFSPLWSISALEQFYLIWPALMLLSSRRALIPLCISGAALAIGWRLVCTYAEMDPIAYTVIPFSGLDQLCIGGLLAICTSDYASQLWSKGFVYATRVSACLFAVLLTGRYFGHEVPWTSYYISLIASLAFAWLSDCARKGIGGLFGKFLNIPLLAHCGKISYAAYLLHNFTELLVPRSPHIRHLLATNYRCLLLIPATFFFADVFWRFFEDPVLRLRESGSLISTLWKNPKAVKASFAAPLIELRRNLVFWGSSVAAAVRGLVVGFAQLPFE